MAWKLLLVLLLEMAGVAMSQFQVPTEPSNASCQPITDITVCENVGYPNASFPNFRNQMTQAEANAELNNFIPLIRLNCSGAIVHMLCAVYAPYCSLPSEVRISPCKNLCEHVRSGCENDLLMFGLQWPPHLQCDRYPSRAEDPLCFGPSDPSDLRIPPIDGVVIIQPTDPEPTPTDPTPTDPTPTPTDSIPILTDPTPTPTDPLPIPTDSTPTLPPDPDSELCLPQQIARVSIRAVLIMSGGSDSATGDQCPATQGLQTTFTQFLRDLILATSFRPGCTFLSTALSSCATRGQRTIAMFSADFTCNGPCIQRNSTSGASENMKTHRQLLMDTIAQEWSVSTTFRDSGVRITYFRRGQQSTIMAVCSAGAAEDNLCNCPATCPPSSSLEEGLRNALTQLDQVTAQVSRLTQQLSGIINREAQVQAKVDTLSTTVEAISNRLDDASSIFVGATLPANLTDVQLYNSCTTLLAATCTVLLAGPGSVGFSVCETANIPINTMSSYTVGAVCARTDSNFEVNPIVTTLRIDNILGVMQCQCWVVVPSDAFPRTQPVTCGLFVTQCPVSQDLAASIQY